MSKSLQFSVFTNLRRASMKYTPAHSKNGENVSQRLQINAYLNENRRGQSEDRSEAISLTAWGNGADILAWCLTPGKEFTVFADLNIYRAPVYYNNQPVNINGEILTRKCYGYTIRRFDLGNDANKHIMDEIQQGVRGVNWWAKGSQDAVNFKAVLDQRMAAAKGGYNAQYGAAFGFAGVEMPSYQHGAYNSNQQAPGGQPSATVGAAPTAATVAAAFTGGAAPTTPARPVVPNSPATPSVQSNPAQSFIMPQTTVPAGV